MIALQPSRPAERAVVAERLLPTDLDTSVLYLPPLLSLLPDQLEAPEPTSDAPHVNWTDSRLPDIDPPSRQLHDALHRFGPIDPAYAHVPYASAFNWADLDLPNDLAHEWCVVRTSAALTGSGTPSCSAPGEAPTPIRISSTRRIARPTRKRCALAAL